MSVKRYVVSVLMLMSLSAVDANAATVDFPCINKDGVRIPCIFSFATSSDIANLDRDVDKSYTEEEGIAQLESLNTLDLSYIDPRKINIWSDNSYNNNSTRIRSFWREEQNLRNRTKGIDNIYDLSGTGSINVYGFANLKESKNNYKYYYHELNPCCSINSMDCNVDYKFSDSYNIPDIYGGSAILSCSNEIYGELAPYSHFNLFYLTNVFFHDDKIKTVPKPSFIFNNFISLDKMIYNCSSSTVTTKFVLNKSYQEGLDCRIKPWYDNYDDFRANIKHKSQDRSIVPEFIVSRHEDVIKKQFVELYDQSVVQAEDGILEVVNIPKYLTINGAERYDQIRQEDFKVDLKKFIDKQSNKIKFKLSAIKKLLPYNGFYPQQRTAQIAGLFSDDYLTATGYVKDSDKLKINHVGYNTTGICDEENIPVVRTLAITQPLFMPGILFNTIKAGIALSWRTNIIDLVDFPGALHDNINAPAVWFERTGDSSITNYQWNVKDITHNFPFETILDPFTYYQKAYEKQDPNHVGEISFDLPTGSYVIPYLDPTHHAFPMSSVNETQISSIKYVRKANLKDFLITGSNASGILYKSAINNFTAEVVNFFIKDNSLTYVSSSALDQITVVSGTLYSMDIVLEKDSNFSMFNQYSTSSHNYIPFASLFGPPVYSGEYLTKEHTEKDPYFPYAPPYMYRDKDTITLSYQSDSDKTISLTELIQNISVSYEMGTNPENKPNVWNRMNLRDCLRYDVISGSSWIIQTKFETPIFNFNLCSTVSSGSANFFNFWDPFAGSYT